MIRQLFLADKGQMPRVCRLLIVRFDKILTSYDNEEAAEVLVDSLRVVDKSVTDESSSRVSPLGTRTLHKPQMDRLYPLSPIDRLPEAFVTCNNDLYAEVPSFPDSEK